MTRAALLAYAPFVDASPAGARPFRRGVLTGGFDVPTGVEPLRHTP